MRLRSSRPAARRRSLGFTLIEVMVALLISALVMTSVLGSLDYTQKAVDAIHNVVETESAGPRLLQLIREDLGRLAVYDVSEYTVFLGVNESIAGADADWMDFLVRRQSMRPIVDFKLNREVSSPLNEVGYRLRMNPNSRDFMEIYRREDFMADDEPFKDGTFTLLYDRVTNFDVRYFKKPELDPPWEEEWDSREMQALPYAIQIDLELEIQPRRSTESLGILGANKARLEFGELITIPEETRWVFRQRLHPVIPEPAEDTGPAAGPGQGRDGQDGDRDRSDTGGDTQAPTGGNDTRTSGGGSFGG